MNLDDLAAMLKGANVTINVQTGDGATMYTGPVQINHNYDAPAQAALPSHDSRCRICGKRLFTEWEFAHGMHGYCDAAERHGTLGQPRERVQLPPMTRYSFPVANTTAHDWQDTDEKAELKSGKVRDW